MPGGKTECQHLVKCLAQAEGPTPEASLRENIRKMCKISPGTVGDCNREATVKRKVARTSIVHLLLSSDYFYSVREGRSTSTSISGGLESICLSYLTRFHKEARHPTAFHPRVRERAEGREANRHDARIEVGVRRVSGSDSQP